MPDEPLRMDAYYYCFEPTKVRAVDEVLSAVACAGKSYHNTESWTDDDDGPSCIDRIEFAASAAAAQFKHLEEEVTRLTSAMRAIRNAAGNGESADAERIAHYALGGDNVYRHEDDPDGDPNA